MNLISPRLTDTEGRLGSLLPAPWVCSWQMGLRIHLLAPCLSPQSQELPTFQRSTPRALSDRIPHRGDFLFFLFACFSFPRFPRDVDCARARRACIRLALSDNDELEKHFIFSLPDCSLTTPGPTRARCVQVYRRPHHRTPERTADCLRAAQGFSVIIDLSLEGKRERERSICWDWLFQWLAGLDLNLYYGKL
ncbi:hypothetical protein CHARACLAT_017041 [Characodon lateralis]|uniref:Uncharacterized protein n=1 Tax=Characodon lateralis TaxID=208331 RepID=A0ABU7F3P5_9TELE|nr:hypothetical protein [Characodon lateralis]